MALVLIYENIEKFKNLLLHDINNIYHFIVHNKYLLLMILLISIVYQFIKKNNGIKKNMKGGSGINLSYQNLKKTISDYSKKPKNNNINIATQLYESKKQTKKQYENNLKLAKMSNKELKENEERIGFFQKIRAKFSKTGEWGGSKGVLGPVFGNLDKIFDGVKNVFYILMIILTIAGIISIPILIFLVITYMVFKYMISTFFIL